MTTNDYQWLPTTNDYQWLLSGYILTISDYILTIFWLHFGYIFATFWLHSDYVLTTFWLHSDYILTTFCLHSDYILTTFWLHSVYILTTFWLFLTISGWLTGCSWPFSLGPVSHYIVFLTTVSQICASKWSNRPENLDLCLEFKIKTVLFSVNLPWYFFTFYGCRRAV